MTTGHAASRQEIWWDDSSHIRRQPQYLSPLSRALMFATIALVAVGLFIQISRTAAISAQSKEISQLRSAIQELTVEQQYLQITLSTRQNIDRVRDEAMGRLGMNYPVEGQVRVVTLPFGQYAGAANQTADGDAVETAYEEGAGM